MKTTTSVLVSMAMFLAPLNVPQSQAQTRFVAAQGNRALKEGQYKAAAAIFSTLLEKDSLCAAYHFQYGDALFGLGQFEEAASALKQAYDLCSSEPVFAVRCVEAYMADGKKTEAKEFCNKAILACESPEWKRILQTLDRCLTATA